jgi:hypothetical protein
MATAMKRRTGETSMKPCLLLSLLLACGISSGTGQGDVVDFVRVYQGKK